MLRPLHLGSANPSPSTTLLHATPTMVLRYQHTVCASLGAGERLFGCSVPHRHPAHADCTSGRPTGARTSHEGAAGPYSRWLRMTRREVGSEDRRRPPLLACPTNSAHLNTKGDDQR